MTLGHFRRGLSSPRRPLAFCAYWLLVFVLNNSWWRDLDTSNKRGVECHIVVGKNDFRACFFF